MGSARFSLVFEEKERDRHSLTLIPGRGGCRPLSARDSHLQISKSSILAWDADRTRSTTRNTPTPSIPSSTPSMSSSTPSMPSSTPTIPSPTRNNASSQSLTTHIVLEWGETSPNGDERHYLTAPDPSDAKILFKSDISTISSDGATGSAVGVFLRLHIPVKLKNVPSRTPIHIHIRPSRVQSCTFAITVDAPEAIRAGSRHQLARLSMKLSGPVQVVVPHTMASSSRPAKNRASGRVLDAIRSLSRATQLVMYMPANLAPRTHLQRLSALLTGGSLQELPPYTELFKLFGGLGGRKWYVEPWYPTTSPPPDSGRERDGKDDREGDCDIPPPYHEACAGPSASPPSKSRKPFPRFTIRFSSIPTANLLL